MRTTKPTKLASLGRSTLAPLLVLIVLSGASPAAPALAAGEPHPLLFEFGTGSGSFENPNGIAIDQSTGDVYVAAIGTETVYRFDASGTPVGFASLGSNALTGAATPAKSFAFPAGARGTPAAVAVDNACWYHQPRLTGAECEAFDPSNGDLYVMDAGHGVIDKYDSEGRYLSQITGYPSATGSTERELLGLAVDAGGVVRVELSIATESGKEGPYAAVDEFNDSLRESLGCHTEELGSLVALGSAALTAAGSRRVRGWPDRR